MPTVTNFGPCRLFFYSDERDEPVHVHVERDRNVAKFWLNPVRLERSGRFPDHELRQIERMVRDNEKLCIEKWEEHFAKR